MLKAVDLSKKAKKSELEDGLPGLRLRLGELQRGARDAGLPIIIVFEGWEAARMAPIINQFLLPLDPRGFSYFNTAEPDRTEKEMPLMWRFWTRTPGRGRIAIFDRSWYSRTVAECLDAVDCKKPPQEVMREIAMFEKQLADDGTVIIKLFLHTSKKKAEKVAEKLADEEACGLLPDDLDIMKHYNEYLPLLEDMMKETDFPEAPWTIIEADDYEYAVLKVFRKVTDRLESALSAPASPPRVKLKDVSGKSDRAKVDLSHEVSDEAYKEELPKYQALMRKTQCDIFREKKRLVVVFEGRDASGKGGDIARLTQTLNPRSYQVAAITAPNDLERSHHYLWRFYKCIPLPGHITIFDRSWYGRLLVERVEGITPKEDWARAYKEIGDFESMLLENDTVLVKLWLEVDKPTQLKRFIERGDDPHKTWKITADDWKSREKWDQYTEAIDEMLLRTSTKGAPWTVVESNDKNHSRIKTLRTIVETVEGSLKK
jgi:polyphosphate:AMP phosphotransferase